MGWNDACLSDLIAAMSKPPVEQPADCLGKNNE
jgi:hypothetical protein